MRVPAACILVAVSVTACGPAGDILPESAFVGDAIPAPLTHVSGDSARGAKIFAGRELGHCVLCHVRSDLDAPFQGHVGPSLDGLNARLTDGQIRLRIVDYQRVVPGALMPSYYRTSGFHQVGEQYEGETVLTAQQVEDLVAYLGNAGAAE